MNKRIAICLAVTVAMSLANHLAISQEKPQTKTNELLNGTVWMQTALEYRVLCHQAYQLARANADKALSDKTWSAATEQSEGFGDLPPAVILDVDETVLDNSAFQARLVKNDVDFNSTIWLSWLAERKATGTPGAKAFIKFLAEREIAVFFVTNRDSSREQATVDNLTSVLGMEVSKEQVLCKYEKKAWASDKTSRRAFIARTHRILMLIGDDFNDFVFLGKAKPEERIKKGNEYQRNFGTKWIQLPNPLYGSWEKSIYDYNYAAGRNAKLKLKYQMLETAQDDE